MTTQKLCFSLIIVCLYVVPILGQSNLSSKELKADRLFTERSYQQASNLLKQEVEKNPDNYGARIKLARTYFMQNEFDLAGQAYMKVINKKHLVNSSDYLYYATTLYSLNRFQTAEKWARRYLEFDPRNIQAQNMLYELEAMYALNQSYQEKTSENTTVSAKMNSATLLEIVSATSNEMYILTNSSVIEVKSISNGINWLKELMDANQIKIESRVRLNPVEYELDKAEIGPTNAHELDKLAALMKSYPFLDFELTGFTDRFGSNEYNQRLSELRAQTALEYLVNRDIQPTRLMAIGAGESETHYRRTEIRLIYLDENQIVSNY